MGGTDGSLLVSCDGYGMAVGRGIAVGMLTMGRVDFYLW